MSSLTAFKKVDKGLFSVFLFFCLFFTFVMKSSVVIVSCGGIAVSLNT